jgi:hypothetical protein
MAIMDFSLNSYIYIDTHMEGSLFGKRVARYVYGKREVRYVLLIIDARL